MTPEDELPARLFREIQLTPTVVVGAIPVFAGTAVIIANNPLDRSFHD